MNETPPAEAAPSAARAKRKRMRSFIGFIVGVALIAAAAWAVSSQQEALEQAQRAVRSASWWLIAAALVLPAMNWLMISGSFWVMMRRHGRVGYGEMMCLIGASWLLNYLPLRAGMVGRVAYHRAVNNIRIADSLRVTVYGLIFAAVSLAILLVAAVLLAGRAAWPLWTAVLAGPALACALACGYCGARHSARWWIPAALGLRYVDTLIWVVRYAVVFALVGSPIDLGAAVAISAVSQVAILIPIVGNGLGIREWAVGLTAAALPAALIGADGEIVKAIGLAADLSNRAAELLLAIPIGLASTWILARRIGGRAADRKAA